MPLASLATFDSFAVRGDAGALRARSLIEEVPVALTAGGSTLAVMMATPADLEDFALGFCLGEGAIADPREFEGVEILHFDEGVEVRMTLAPTAEERFLKRRRMMAGPVGCGLCGLESLIEAAHRPPEVTAAGSIGPRAIAAALQGLSVAQRLHGATRSAHGAGLWDCRRGRLTLMREDVGRHNALDKLFGAAMREGLAPDQTAVVLTSRVSVELIQKCARFGAPILIAMSAPTTLAVRAAETAGLTLIGVARDDGFEAFTRRDRLEF